MHTRALALSLSQPYHYCNFLHVACVPPAINIRQTLKIDIACISLFEHTHTHKHRCGEDTSEQEKKDATLIYNCRRVWLVLSQHQCNEQALWNSLCVVTAIFPTYVRNIRHKLKHTHIKKDQANTEGNEIVNGIVYYWIHKYNSQYINSIWIWWACCFSRMDVVMLRCTVQIEMRTSLQGLFLPSSLSLSAFVCLPLAQRITVMRAFNRRA